jgi:hypothetical protein
MFVALLLTMLLVTPGHAQKQVWSERVVATNTFLQRHMWNANTGNFIRRSDNPGTMGSDAWGITIMLDAYAYMVESGFMKASDMKSYFQSSSALYEKTGGDRGARILARQGAQTYVGGDDELQWIAALAHCYEVTKDSDYLNTAQNAFRALIDLGFWKEGDSKGWAWNSQDQRPNGVSTAYGALAAARLFQSTRIDVYKQWAAVSINALKTPQVGFFARDMMVAANAAMTVYEVTHQPEYLKRATELATQAGVEADQIIAGTRKGERNPTDVADVAEGFEHLSALTGNASYHAHARKLAEFFLKDRSPEDISEHGFYSRYLPTGKPDLAGAYLGVPLSASYLPEVAEMLKICAIEYKYSK